MLKGESIQVICLSSKTSLHLALLVVVFFPLSPIGYVVTICVVFVETVC